MQNLARTAVRSGRNTGAAAPQRNLAAMTAASMEVEKPVKVMKFGGSSVGSADAMKRVAGIVGDEKRNHDVVSVLSAMYGVTNTLVKATTAATQRDLGSIRDLRDELISLHGAAADDMFLDPTAKARCMEYVENSVRQHFDAPLEEIMEHGECTARHGDQVWSLGERFTNKMLAEYMNSDGRIGGRLVEADRVVVTDDVPGGASPLLEETRERVERYVKPMLQDGATPFVTGYFGASKDGTITTLGRGGSDLSASVLAYSLEAQAVELYKVECTTNEEGWLDTWEPGWEGVVHDADPTHTIPTLAYEEAAELAHFGKKVLHPQCVFPAVMKGIPIAIKNTLRPENQGTVVCQDPATLSELALAAADADAENVAVEESEEASGASAYDGPAVTTITKTSLDKYRDAHGAELRLPEWAASPKDATLIVAVGRSASDPEHVQGNVTELLTGLGIPYHTPDHVNGSSHHFTVIVPSSAAKSTVAMLHDNLVDASVNGAAQ